MKKLIPIIVVVSSLTSVGFTLARTPLSAAVPALQEVTPSPDQTITPTPTSVPNLEASTIVEHQLVEDRNGDGKVDPGDTIRNTITYANTGIIAGSNTILRAICDTHLIAGVGNITIPGMPEDDGAISWELGDLPAQSEDSVSYDAILIESFPPSTTSLKCRVTLNATELDEPIALESTLDLPSPILTVKKEGETIDLNNNGVLDGGESVRYTITYENIGSATAPNVVIRDDYPQELIAIIDNITGDGKNDDDVITWEITSVAAGDSKSLQYVAILKEKLPQGTTGIENTVEIVSDRTDPASGANLIPITLPELTITKVTALISDLNENGNPDPGDTIQYTIKFVNNGKGDATEVVIIDDYPETLFDGVVISEGSNVNGNEISGKDDGSMIAWDIGTLAKETNGEVRYQATLGNSFVVGPNQVDNKVTITSKEVEPDTATSMLKVNVVPTPSPTPEPATVVGEGVSAGIYKENPTIPSVLLGVLAFFVLGALIYTGTQEPKSLSEPIPELPKDADSALMEKYIELTQQRNSFAQQRLSLIREGVFLVFIISAILILAIGEGIKQDGAISILSAIVGYVFGRAASR
jgi:uncharacterized repeat protein (TIGR01451 family)